ncbi:MAG TPA: class I SAM-dependent methyltransferase [Candidatus Kapabacteria bacterium]|nr:class I SAM-dependent methyltransferase [Candidatus Kapabacteria bacterium]
MSVTTGIGTDNAKTIVENEPSLLPVEKYLWGYMYDLAREYMIPYLESKNVRITGASIIEIGCAEGGNLCAMAAHGARELAGTDIAEDRLATASRIADILGMPISYSTHDIIGQDPMPEWLGRFDVAFLRDVIEHLDDATIALRNIRKVLKPGGALYVTFPPYYSPFGGHQHLLHTWPGRIPFMHLLPRPLFEAMIASSKSEIDKVEVRRLRRIRMSTSKMRAAAGAAGFTIADERLFAIRPVFKMKFGLHPIGANFLKPIPGLRDVFALEAGYLLKNGHEA